MKKSIWLSYDLGVKGDYTSLYEWLDSHEAVECGDSIAYFKFEWVQESDTPLPDALKSELTESVRIKKTDRVYIIWREHSKVRGKYIIGSRKVAPWAGFAGRPSEIDEGEA